MKTLLLTSFVRARRRWRRWFARRIIFERGPKLTDIQIIRALAAEVEGVPTFGAVIQLIDELEDVCIETSIGLVGDYGALASETGGVQVLRELRDKLLTYRERGKRDDEED